MKKQTQILFALLFLASIFCSTIKIVAQNSHIAYEYDEAGNRQHREFHLNVEGPSGSSRVAHIDTTSKQANPKDEQAIEQANKYGISVNPNPVTDAVNITIISASDQEPATVYVYDNAGKLALSKQIITGSQEQLNFETLKTGIYNIKVLVGKEPLFYKVVKN